MKSATDHPAPSRLSILQGHLREHHIHSTRRCCAVCRTLAPPFAQAWACKVKGRSDYDELAERYALIGATFFGIAVARFWTTVRSVGS